MSFTLERVRELMAVEEGWPQEYVADLRGFVPREEAAAMTAEILERAIESCETTSRLQAWLKVAFATRHLAAHVKIDQSDAKGSEGDPLLKIAFYATHPEAGDVRRFGIMTRPVGVRWGGGPIPPGFASEGDEDVN